MAVFSTNQNRQLYVAKAYKELGSSDTVASKLTTVGDVTVTKDKDGAIHIHQLGHGGLIKSDAIEAVTYAKASAPADMALKLKKVTLSLDTNVGNGKPIAGQDYIVRVNFRQMYGMSDEDIYQKYGAVHATKAMNTTPALFWAEMAYSLVKNFSRSTMPAPLLEVEVAGTVVARATKVNGAVKLYSAAGTEISTTGITSIAIVEKSQVEQWSLGTAQLVPVYFEVIPTTVFDGTDELSWGVVSTTSAGTVGNGYNTADLEYFCMGERGDQYRLAMWPKNIKTKYMVDETKTYFYLDIHYSYSGSCEDVQKSEKDITIVAESAATIASIVAAMGITVKDTPAFKTANTGDTTNNGIVD